MGILVPKEHRFYCLARATEIVENNERLQNTFQKDSLTLESMRKKIASGEDAKSHSELFESMILSSFLFHQGYVDVGPSNSILENVIKVLGQLRMEGFDLLMSNPVANSKHPADCIILDENCADTDAIKRRYDELVSTDSSDDKANKVKNEFWSSTCVGPHVRFNVKGMCVSLTTRGVNKGKIRGTITLSRNGKNQGSKKDKSQDGQKFDINIASEKINGEFGKNGIITHVSVWFRIRSEGCWKNMGVAFPSSFFACEAEEFKQYGEQSQYKFENHTSCSYLTINPGASHQLNCHFNDLIGLIKTSGATVFYDSTGFYTCV